VREPLRITHPMLGPKRKIETISIKKRLQIGDVLMSDLRTAAKIGVKSVSRRFIRGLPVSGASSLARPLALDIDPSSR
jgi:hypothetical protein